MAIVAPPARGAGQTNNPLTPRIALLFFLPLILTTELHQFSHALVHGFLARMGDPTVTLAAFSVAFSFNTTFSGIISVGTQAGISYISDKRSFWKVARFYCYVALVPFIFIEAVALTPLGDWLFGKMMGASAETTRLAKAASSVMGLWIAPNSARNLATALCMLNRRTMPISHATMLRLISQALLLLVLPFWLEGAVAGAASLVGCMTVEALYLYRVSKPMYEALPGRGGEQPTDRQMWSFSWPLMVTTMAENGVNFIINFFLGRLANPDLALAAFGVVNALKSLVASPLRNLMQTAQALVHSRADMRVILHFAKRLTLVYAVIVGILFYTPLRDVILGSIMGLPAKLRDYAIPGMQMVIMVVVVWGYSSLFRGLLAAMRKTHIIAGTALVRFLVVVLVGSTTLIVPTLNGAAVGVAAIGSAFLAEALILGWRVMFYARSREAIFPRERQGPA